MSDFEGQQDELMIHERLPSDPPPPQTLEAAFGSAVQPTLEELQEAAAEELCTRAKEVSERYPDELDGSWLTTQLSTHPMDAFTYNTVAEDLQTLMQYSGMLTQMVDGLTARVEELEAELAQVSRSNNP